MKKLLFGFLALLSIPAFAQVFTYSYPRIEGDYLHPKVSAYVTPNSNLDNLCQYLSGGDPSSYAISWKTKKTVTKWSESKDYIDLVKFQDKLSMRFFLRTDSDDKRKDRVISELECQVFGVVTKVYITDYTSEIKNEYKQAEEITTKSFSEETIKPVISPSRLSCGGQKAYTYGWGGQRYNSSERADCIAAKNEAINNCLNQEGARGASACKTNVSSCLTNPCTTSFIGRTYGWAGERYESSRRTTCAQGKQEAINNCQYEEGSRGAAACKDNASCVELND